MGGTLLAQVPTPSRVVSQYLQAVQRRDYLTAAKLTHGFKLEEFEIQDRNPRSLWPVLLTELWNKKAWDLEKKEIAKPVTWRAREDMPIERFRDLQTYMATTATWKVLEVRNHGRAAGTDLSQLEVYVSVSYPSPEKAPIVDHRALKGTILTFWLTAPLLNGVDVGGRVEKADVFWPETQRAP